MTTNKSVFYIILFVQEAMVNLKVLFQTSCSLPSLNEFCPLVLLPTLFPLLFSLLPSCCQAIMLSSFLPSALMLLTGREFLELKINNMSKSRTMTMQFLTDLICLSAIRRVKSPQNVFIMTTFLWGLSFVLWIHCYARTLASGSWQSPPDENFGDQIIIFTWWPNHNSQFLQNIISLEV